MFVLFVTKTFPHTYCSSGAVNTTEWEEHIYLHITIRVLRLWTGYSDVLLPAQTADVKRILLPPYLGNPEQWQDINFPFFSEQG
jgi:hypothetical protein